MPQRKKRKSAEEILGIAPRPRKSAEEILGIAPPAPATREFGTAKNLGLGAEQEVYSNIVPSALSGLEAVGSALTGDVGPAREIGESLLRGAGQLLMGGNPSFAGPSRANAEAIARIEAEKQARRAGDPLYGAVEQARQEVEAEAAQDPSLRGRVTRGVGRFATAAAPAVVTGVLTGGSVPAMTAVTAAQSLNQPENIPVAAALGAIPVPALAPVLRRVKNLVGPKAAAEARQVIKEAVAASGEASPAVQRAIAQFSQVVDDIKAAKFTQKQQVQAFDDAIRAIGREASGARPVSADARRGYPSPIQEFPANPNAAQVRGRLPGEAGPPRLEAELDAPQSFEVKAALELAYSETVGPSVGPVDKLEAAVAKATERSPWQDTALAYFRANLLTNPVGRATDLGSTIISQFADAAARPIAAAVDVVVSKLTGARSITGPSLRGTGRALGSIGEGLRDVGKVLKTGKQAIDSGADDALYGAEIRSGLGKAVDVPINGVFRVLGALDAPFRRFGYARNLFDRARVAAINEAKRGKIPWEQATARVRELLDDGDIIRAAIRDGERAVLSEPNKISSWLAAQTRSAPNARLAIGLVQPFMRIPLNAVLKAADFSGLGGVKALYKIARGVGRKTRAKPFFRDLEDQRVFSQNVAAGSFGVAGFLLGMELQERGKLEGYFYTSKKDFPNKKVPTSIEIAGTRYEINRLGGFIAAPLFIGATYNRLRKQNADKANALLRSFSGLVQTAPSLGYYGAPAKLGRLFTADEPGDVILQEAGSTVSGFIPASGALGTAAKALDSEKKREAEGFLGPIMNRVPGLRQQLPRKKRKRGR